MIDTVSLGSSQGAGLSRRSCDTEHVRLLRAAVRHRYNLVGIVACMVVALPMGCGALGLLLVASQLASWLVLPRVAWFRRQIAAERAEEERRTAVAVRASALGRLSEEHRLRFMRLECLVDEIGNHLVNAGADDVGDCYGLRWLLSSYLGVATAHRAARQAISAMPRDVLAMEVFAIRKQEASRPRNHKLHEQRREIAEQRLSRWDRTADELERLGEQLAMIDSIIQLAHESSIAATSIDGASASAQQLLDDLTAGRGYLEALSTLPNQHESIDPRVFMTREEETPVARIERESTPVLFETATVKAT